MIELPSDALSVRQPWAWAIVHARKGIENREWRASNPGLRYRGRVAIHASQNISRDYYADAASFMLEVIGIRCPAPAALERGGIIGSVDIVDDVTASDSPWFFGPRGLVLRQPKPCAFVPAVGALGFFKWTPAEPAIIPAPARWMLPAAAAAPATPHPETNQGRLL